MQLHDAVSRAKAALKREDETRDLCDKNSAAAIMWESQFMQLDRMHSILKTDHHQYIVRLAAAESEATKLRTDLHRIQQELHAEQLKSKNDDADDPQGASLAECQICFDARADTVCVPCGTQV
jgi:predicted RNase H-like nuclease (RuvC/YqgF family)